MAKGKGMVKGFANVQAQMVKEQGIPPAKAGAILANVTRKASPEAKKANPALKNVKGK